MKICLTSFATPWFFGPYGQQLRILAEELYKLKHEIYFLVLDMELPLNIYSYSTLRNSDQDKNNVNIDENIWKNIKFLGGVKKLNSKILSSNLKKIINSHNIECIIMCSDINKLYFDETFNFKSLIWYPNHFSPIDIYNKAILKNFSHIVSLCPTDKKQLENIFPNKRIEYIPHIVKIDRKKKNKSDIRKKYNIDNNKFIVLINSGNYDFQNRKSLDTSIFACDKFMKNKKDVVLFIHTYGLKDLNDSNKHLEIQGELRINDIISYTSIPKDQIIIQNKIIPYDNILDIMEMSDVLLQGSKSEGFGIPIIESQLLGVPVVTTEFGAMKDNTFYGISVPYYQKCFDNLSSGIWVTPDINGISNALDNIYTKNFKDNKDLAIEKIKKLMSKESVLEKFIELIEEKFTITEPKNENKKILTIINLSNDKYFIDGKLYDELDYNIINSEWVFINDNFITSQNEIENILSGYHDNDIILLKTLYPDNVYPTLSDIQNGNIMIDKINFCIKTKYLNFIDKNIKGKYINKALFVSFSSNIKTALAESILCKKNIQTSINI
jgi:hypothetical protein